MALQAANFNVNGVFQIDHSQKVSSLITINVKHFVICVAVYHRSSVVWVKTLSCNVMQF